MKKPLTLEEYMSARLVADPIALYDCVMPCAGAEAFLVMSERSARQRNLPFARLRSTIERHNAFPDDPIQIRGGWVLDVDELWDLAGAGPQDVDFLQTYDDYPVIVMQQIEDLGFCAKGEGPAFVRERALSFDGGGLPVNTSGGQLSAGQAGFAGGYIGVVEAMSQLLGTAGERQVPGARTGMVSGYGMVMYDHCLCTAAAILARGQH